MSPAKFIGLDFGTGGARASAVNATGETLARAAAPFADYADPAQWRAGLSAVLRDLAGAIDLSAVQALAVAGTSGTVLAADAEGVPIGPPVMYDSPEPARVARLQARPGAVHVLHQADWIAGLLMRRFGDSDANNALKSGYDPEAEGWTIPNTAKLPRVHRPGTPLGPVAPGWGLPTSAWVKAGTTDGCASFLAAGASEIGDAVTALGSTLVLKILSPRAITAPAYGVYSHRIGPGWLAGGASNTGGRALAQLFGRERLATLSARLDPDTPTGLDYYPLLTPGERFPRNDPTLPPRLTPRPAEEAVFLQGVLESLARIEAEGYRRLAEFGAPPPRSVRTVGGGAANAAWTRIRARILGVDLLPARSVEASDGAALLAGDLFPN